MSAAIHPGRFEQLTGQLQEKLPEQKCSEGGCHKGHSKPLKGIHPVPCLHGQVVGNDGYLPWDHHGGQEQCEPEGFAVEPQM
ncbi:hypothetical protein D3C71_2131440 [compost metagenome]